MVKAHILVVEDESVVAMDIKYRLENLGYDVSATLSSGESAIEKIPEFNPDLVLMDVVLKGQMDGIEAAERIKQLFDVPVIYLTAYGDDKTLERAKITEPYGYILKPFESRELYTTIEMALYKSKMQKDLKASEEKYRRLINTLPNIVFKGYADWSVDFFDDKIEKISGYAKDDFNSRRLKWSDIIVTDDLEPAKEIFAESLKTNKLYIREYRIKTKDAVIVWLQESSQIVCNKHGEIEFIIGAFLNITERKKAEEALKEAQQTIIYSEKMAAVGRLSSGIAHEVKNPLGIILGGVEFLRNKLPASDEDALSAMDKIEKSVMRADDVIQGLLKFSRPSEVRIEAINIHELINDAVSLLKYKAQLNNIKIVTSFTQEPVSLEADKMQIEQMLFNLLVNACEAVSAGGVINITSHLQRFPDPVTGDLFCTITVMDNGEGISKENLSKILEPFFTTKRDKKGTGLGLYISKMIVDNHKGFLDIKSEQGKGTEVAVSLPLN
ncbi:MAG: ATP-binding protein [Candidatus Omnitrophota bacterium]|jgi:PAS domain S-box-containing protein